MKRSRSQPAGEERRGTSSLSLTVRQWTLGEFESSERDWQLLLEQSDADPLFMSWIWQRTWWKHYGASIKSKLKIFAAYAPDGRLVGIAPLHLRRAFHRKYLTAHRLELLGSAFRESGDAFSEYLDFIVDRAFVSQFKSVLAGLLLDHIDWSDFVVANSKSDSVAVQFVNEFLKHACYVRSVDNLFAYQVSLPSTFDSYLRQVPAVVRRKLWNNRIKVRHLRYERCDISCLEAFFSEMDELHLSRWNKPHFVGVLGHFHRELAVALHARGALRLSRLSNDQGTLSLMYDIYIAGTQYNIQSAFNPHNSQGISPGYMHFGYSIEAACDAGLVVFDFLAGRGRSTNYKEDFATRKSLIVSIQSIRSRPLAWLYRQYDQRLRGVASAYLPFIGAIPDGVFFSIA